MLASADPCKIRAGNAAALLVVEVVAAPVMIHTCTCYRCQRCGHWAYNCDFVHTVLGEVIPSSDDEDDEDDEDEDDDDDGGGF